MPHQTRTHDPQMCISELVVLSAKQEAHETIEMVLKHKQISQISRPGQFLHVILDGHMLARPLSIANCNTEKGTVTLLFKTEGAGTRLLAKSKPGSVIRALGPVGNGFPLDVKPGSDIVLIGGGIGIPPLYFLGKALKEKGASITSILGYQSAHHVFYEQAFSGIGKTIIMTDDGTYGQKGLVTKKLANFNDVDRYYSCGPIPMLRAVENEMKDTVGFLSLEERMGCGVGTCMACVIPSQNGGYRKICSDGPVFPSGEVLV